MGRLCKAGLVLVLALFWASVALSQDLRSPILTIDSERFYRESAFGQRVLNEIEARTTELADDNRTLEAELEAEEQALTEQRAEMAPEAFRALADAFDARVEVIRRERDARSRAIADLLEQNRGQFLNAAAPVLEEIMRDAGAAVILEQRSVFVSANAIDITNLAISRMNSVLGDGTQAD
ncbi:MAG: OmpH family outer membrane protein [Pseudomonadota bacterium]